MEKSASARVPINWGMLGRDAAAGVGAAGFMDAMHHRDVGGIGDYLRSWKDPTVGRLGMGALNVAMGGFGRRYIMKPNWAEKSLGATTLLGIPAKDVAIEAPYAIREATRFMNNERTRDRILPIAAGGLAAAIPIYMGLKALRDRIPDRSELRALTESNRAASGGRIRVALPPPEPGMSETVVDMPIEHAHISNTLRDNISRDVRRRLRTGTQARTFVRTDEGLRPRALTTE